MTDELTTPNVKAAVAEERRFGGIEAQLVGLRASVDALTVKVGEQNGRVGKLEVRFDTFVTEQKLASARKEGQLQQMSLFDKILMRALGLVAAVGSAFVALQSMGVI